MTGDALHIHHSGVDRDGVIAAPVKFAEKAAGEILGVARNADYGDAFRRQKVVDVFASGHY